MSLQSVIRRAGAFRPGACLPLFTALALTLAGCAPRAPGETVGQAAAAVCLGASFAPSVPYAAPGATVTWTGSASCDLGDTLEYQFLMQPPGGDWGIAQPYGSSSSFVWDTSGLSEGLYDFQIWAHADGDPAPWSAYQDRTFSLTSAVPCAGGALTFGPSSPSIPGALVTASGAATCSGAPEYEFWMQPPGGDWTVAQAYGPSSAFDWDTTGAPLGTYDVQVWIRNQGSAAAWETYQGSTYTLGDGAAACTGGALAFSSASPAIPGTDVSISGTASCGDPPEYEFWMQPPGGAWSIVQPYGPSSAYDFDTTGLPLGTYDFEVWVRNQGSGAAWETYQSSTYTLDDGAPACTGGALGFSPASPATIGTQITVSGTATCGDAPEYEFWMQPPGGVWSVVQPYSPAASFGLDTTGLASGSYDFQVRVRNQGSGAAWETYQGSTYGVFRAPQMGASTTLVDGWWPTTESLVALYEATPEGSPLDGFGKVKNLVDLSGNGNDGPLQATAMARPKWNASDALGGRPSWSFDYTSTFLQTPVLNLAPPYTVILVAASPIAQPEQDEFVLGGLGAENADILYDGRTSYFAFDPSSDAAILSPVSYAAGACVVAQRDGAHASITVGASSATTIDTGTDVTQMFTVGANRYQADPWNGPVYFVAFFDTALTSAQIAAWRVAIFARFTV